jgi:alanine-glyoxylate transaminase/(R)-3-amino-2-methylpropionate-pyruvate transaminase
MQWLWDHTGDRYLDMFGGIVTVSVGHCHPKVNEALKQQVDTLWHTTSIYLQVNPWPQDIFSRFTSKVST